MAYLILFILISNTTIFLSNFFKEKFEKTLFLGIFTYVFILYVFGLFSLLNIGFIIILLLNFIAFIYNIILLIKKKIKKENILTVGFILFLISFFVIAWQSNGRIAQEWDEFSHWAIVVKHMYGTNSLKIGIDTNVMFNYLSGTSIFQYFCVKLSGSFNEAMMFMGQGILITSFILPVMSLFEKKKKILPYIFYCILFLLPTLFYPTIYCSLYVDGILALGFAYSLYSYFINKDNNPKFNNISLPLSLMMLVFIKDFGFYLSIGTYLIVLINQLFIKNKFSLKTIKDNILVILSILPPLLLKFSWSMALNIWNTGASWNTDNILNTVFNILSLNLMPYQKETIFNFSDAIFSTNITNSNYNITSFIVFIICIFIAYLFLKKVENKDKKEVYLVSSLIILGFIAYAALILLAYLSVFSEYEALRLASFNRYIGSYALGMLIVFIVINLQILKNNKIEIEKFIMILLVVFCVVYNYNPLINMTIKARNQAYLTNLNRSGFNNFEQLVNENIKKGEKVYFIYTNTNGYEYYVAKYVITPYKLNSNCWSIGNSAYGENDIWTCIKTVDEWKNLLIEEYDYVYLFGIDDKFINQYGILFDNENIANNQLYKITNKDDKKILKKVNNS